jgi:hypothetical protein
MRKIITGSMIAFAAAFTVLFIAETTQAQPRRARGRVYTKSEVNRVIKRVETSVDIFRKEFDKSLDRSRLNNTEREDNLNEKAKQLESETDELRREFDRHDAWIENRDEVRRCLNIATDINVAMRNRRLGGKTESTWARVRADLNTLAQIYNLPGVGSGAY